MGFFVAPLAATLVQFVSNNGRHGGRGGQKFRGEGRGARARSYPINVKRGTVNKKLALRSSSFSFLLFSFLLLRPHEYYAITKLTAMQLSRCTRAFSHTTVFSPWFLRGRSRARFSISWEIIDPVSTFVLPSVSRELNILFYFERTSCADESIDFFPTWSINQVC